MKVLLVIALVIVSLSSSSQESPRRPNTLSSQAHPVVPRNTTGKFHRETQELNATGTHDMEKKEIETYCMIALFVVLFFFFAAIAAVQEYKQSPKKLRLVDNQNREEFELVTMRAIENGIEETAV